MTTEERVASLEATVHRNGLMSRVRRIENRQWSIMVITLFTLVGVVIQLVI